MSFSVERESVTGITKNEIHMMQFNDIAEVTGISKSKMGMMQLLDPTNFSQMNEELIFQHRHSEDEIKRIPSSSTPTNGCESSRDNADVELAIVEIKQNKITIIDGNDDEPN